MKKKILVIDIGGTRVKLLLSRRTKRKFDSGPKMTPREMIADIKKTAEGWNYDAISIGFPAPVKEGKIASEPKHLGEGWVGFDFAKPLGKPVEIINDAAMQALGSYHGGRMLFLALVRPWFGKDTFYRSSSAICLTSTMESLKTRSGRKALSGSARKTGKRK